MQAFRADFARQVPVRLQDARACLAACLDAPRDDERLRALHAVVHKLAGTAGTFGMDALGDAALAAEEAVDALLARSGRDAADFRAVEERVAALAQAAA